MHLMRRVRVLTFVRSEIWPDRTNFLRLLEETALVKRYSGMVRRGYDAGVVS